MSDWDDFLYWENQRLENGGIPLDGDPFNDPADFIEEEIEDEQEEPTPVDTREYHSREDFVCSYLITFLLSWGFQPDWSLEVTFNTRDNLTIEIVPWKRTSQRPNLIPIADLVTDNGKGDYIPDLEKIKKELKNLEESLL